MQQSAVTIWCCSTLWKRRQPILLSTADMAGAYISQEVPAAVDRSPATWRLHSTDRKGSRTIAILRDHPENPAQCSVQQLVLLIHC